MRDVWDRIAALPEEKRALLMRQLQERKMATEASPDQYDVAILGGGMAGLTLALQLKKTHPAMRIVVMEKQGHPVMEAAHKVGESTVEIAAHYLRDILGLHEHLQTQQLRKFGLRMFFSTADNQDITRRVELGPTVFPPLCTYQLDRGRLENGLGCELPRQGVAFLDGCKVQQVALQPQSAFHRLCIQHDGRDCEIQARWIVDASGRSSLLKRQLGLAKKMEHNANAIWFRIGYPIDIRTWSTDPDWLTRVTEGDRSLSTNHLMGPGYWVWLIRLASGSTSVGIVTDAAMHPFEGISRFERALTWLHSHEPQCGAVIEQHRATVQDFRVMKNYAYSCQQVYSSERWCLTGEAAVSIDPLYSPGGDFIAIGNGLICDLISRSLNGEDTRGRAVIHNKLFLTLVDVWLGIYAHQYALMGNAQVMVTKTIWDTAIYWGILGLLYFHDKFRRLIDSPEVTANLLRFSSLSNRVQAFFREWHAIDQPAVSDTFVDLYSPLDFMVKLHTGLAAGLRDPELEVQFAANIRLFERLAGQIVSEVIVAYADHTENEAIQSQLQRWQTEPLLAELIALCHQESASNPIDSNWIALAHQGRAKQEIAK
jgi:2-polyprenyl-6-methoxyphenol hydroxylase-like FAD-dependent oxidoreductase